MDEKTMSRADVAKRLRILFYLAFVGLVPPLMCLAPQLLVAADWAALAVSVANAAVLLSLAAAGKRYRSAGLLAVIAAVCSLLAMFVATSVLSSAAGICGLIGMYNEYEGHADQVREQDPKQAKRWSSLFIWQICLGFLMGILAVTVAFMSVGMNMAERTVLLISLLVPMFISLGLQIVYIIYLNRTCRLLESGEA